MEEDKHIDQLFRDTLETHSMEPSAKVWDSLDARLHAAAQARKSGRGRRWLLLLALLLLCGSMGWYFSGPGSGDSGNGDYLAHNNSSARLTAGGPGKPSSFHADGAANPAAPVQSYAKTNTIDPGMQEKSPGSSAGSTGATTAFLSHSSVPVAHSFVPASPASPAAQDPGSAGTMGNAASSAPKPTDPALANQTANASLNRETVPNSLSGPEILATAPAIVTNANSVTAESTNEAQTPAAVSAESAMDSSETLKTLAKEAPVHSAVRHIVADVYFAPELSNRTLVHNDDYTGSGSGNAASSYDQNITTNYAWSSAIRLRYELGSHWSIGSGVGYSVVSQNTELDNVYMISDSAFEHDHGHHWHGGSGGPGGGSHHSHFVMHTSCGTITLQGEPPHQSNNHCENPPRDGDTLHLSATTTEVIETFNIPLVVRYSIRKARWTAYAEGGAAINILHHNSATVQVSDAYSESGDIVGLKKTSYSLLFSAGLEYHLTKYFGCFAEPALRYNVTPINENSPINTYPWYLGLRAGFGVHF